MTTTASPSERDRFWLDHEAKIAASGQTAKEYAAKHELSLHALYQSRKRLRSLGLFPEARGKAATSAKSAGFSRVRLSPIEPSAPTARFCLRFPAGVALEWSGDAIPESVIQLVERLVQHR